MTEINLKVSVMPLDFLIGREEAEVVIASLKFSYRGAVRGIPLAQQWHRQDCFVKS